MNPLSVFRVLIRCLLVFGLSGLYVNATADTCGAQGERPCKVGERIPSCDFNLVEAAGQCIRPECGAAGMKPCTVLQRPSFAVLLGLPVARGCDVDMRFNLTTGNCEHPPCGAEGAAACPVWERVPSCDVNLVESAGKCVHPRDCGRLNQRSCDAMERLNRPCDINLVVRNGVCSQAGNPNAVQPVQQPPQPSPSPAPAPAPANPAPANPAPPKPAQPPAAPPGPVLAPPLMTGGPLFPAGVPEPDTDRLGADLYGFPLTQANAQACQATCDAHAQCAAWTFVKPGVKGPAAMCFLKSTIATARRDTCCISGVKPRR